MAAWAWLSAVCQQFLDKPALVDSRPIRLGPLDSLLLLAILLTADGAASSLVVGYPLVIVASGLWFRVRFVWFITVLSWLPTASWCSIFIAGGRGCRPASIPAQATHHFRRGPGGFGIVGGLSGASRADTERFLPGRGGLGKKNRPYPAHSVPILTKIFTQRRKGTKKKRATDRHRSNMDKRNQITPLTE